jgi:hypothetical protein
LDAAQVFRIDPGLRLGQLRVRGGSPNAVAVAAGANLVVRTPGVVGSPEEPVRDWRWPLSPVPIGFLGVEKVVDNTSSPTEISADATRRPGGQPAMEENRTHALPNIDP